MSEGSSLLVDVLNSNWRAYETHVTERKLNNSTVSCCLCRQTSHLSIDEHRSLTSVVCKCSHPLCADCSVHSDVFSTLHGLRHRVHARDRFRYSFGFYCDGCGASNKVSPVLQSKDVNSPTPKPSRPPCTRSRDKAYYVDFTWRGCRWCKQRCHLKCLLYRIKPWELPPAPTKSPKRARREYDAHTKDVRARLATGSPSSPLALFASTPADLALDKNASSSSSRGTTCSPTPEEIETLKYGL